MTKMKVTLTRVTQNPVLAIEEAASNCYDSQPTADGRIMNACYKSGHHSVLEFADFTFHIEFISRACYDDKTEILTSEGWKLFKDVKDDERVLTLNKNGEAEFQQILNKTMYFYDGIMHKYKSQNIDLLVTPNHNLYIKKYDVRTHANYSLEPSESININRFYMNKVVKYNNEVDENFIIKGYSYERKDNQGNTYTKTTPDLILNRENFYKLLAWYLSEGSVYYNEKENSYSISICQLKEKNIPVIKQIVEDNGFKCCYDGQCIKFKNQTLGRFLYNLGNSYQKNIPFNIFDNFNNKLAKIFIDEYIKGDGTIDKNKCGKIYTISPKLAEQLYSLCFMAGYTATQHINDRSGCYHIWNNHKITYNYPCYIINLSMSGKKKYEVVVKKNKHFSEQNYSGMVYCVEVPNHILFVRRNNIALWCGNCSHQVVRHREASYAQRSQRYVEEDNFAYVTPPTIQVNKDALIIYMEHMVNCQQAYNALVGLGIPAEDARYVLPNACATVIEVKMNGRELIHLANERLCTRAQWEIRRMVQKMKQCVEEYDEECRKFSKYLVPKCCAHAPFKFCTEHKSCGIAPRLSDVYDAYVKQVEQNE